MIAPPIRCVVDCSVAIKLVFTEPDSAQAHLLFDHPDRDPLAQFDVPDLFRFECANVLRTQAKRGRITGADAGLKLVELQGKRLQVWDSASLIGDALTVAVNYDLSAYDASYVAASAEAGVPLITADDKLVRKLLGTSFSVLLLSSLTIPPPPP
jgi:predicted nucleic acid-binding protein